jgi:hypothetical protein
MAKKQDPGLERTIRAALSRSAVFSALAFSTLCVLATCSTALAQGRQGRVEGVKGKEVTVNIGAAEGVKKGMTGTIFINEQSQGKMRRSEIATVVVDLVELHRSFATVTDVADGRSVEQSLEVIFPTPPGGDAPEQGGDSNGPPGGSKEPAGPKLQTPHGRSAKAREIEASSEPEPEDSARTEALSGHWEEASRQYISLLRRDSSNRTIMMKAALVCVLGARSGMNRNLIESCSRELGLSPDRPESAIQELDKAREARPQ